MSSTVTRAGYGPIQLGDHLGLDRSQFARARRRGLVPAPDIDGRRWSAAAVADLDPQVLSGQVGACPDLGAARAAAALATAVGRQVSPDAIVELARSGPLRTVGEHHGHRIYDGGDLEALAGTVEAATLARAEQDGALHTAAQAAAYLRLRRCDVEHLVRAGYLHPAAWGRHQWQRSREAPAVPLYRRGDLDHLDARDDLDLQAVRATPAGRRSVLASLPTA